MEIKLHDVGAAVEDVQQRLAQVGILESEDASGIFDDKTAQAVRRFCAHMSIPPTDVVDDKIWAALVDATFSMGDRTLYLRMPYFHGNDVMQLQKALGALGFACGQVDGIFGAYTELALRKFQMNMGLPSDGIAGAYTFMALHNLEHSWVGKEAPHAPLYLGFARAADVLEDNALCLFGTDEFTRDVARRMSNLALATNPASHIVSADALSVTPDQNMLLVHVTVEGRPHEPNVPVVDYAPFDTMALRLASALEVARLNAPPRLVVELPSETWKDAGATRSAQHYAINLLDGLCSALS